MDWIFLGRFLVFKELVNLFFGGSGFGSRFGFLKDLGSTGLRLVFQGSGSGFFRIGFLGLSTVIGSSAVQKGTWIRVHWLNWIIKTEVD
jgi:hypothetical protein